VRIVSLLPAGTEIVVALGLDDELVGVGHRAAAPIGLAQPPLVTRSGSGRSHPDVLDVDAFVAADPDLVLIGQGDDGTIDARGLQDAIGGRTHPSVLPITPGSVEGVLNAIVAVGAMTESEDEALAVVEDLRERLKVLQEVVLGRRDHGFRPPRAVVLDAVDPPRATGRWVPDQVRLAGGWELLGQAGEPARATTWSDVAEVDPEVLVLLPGGLPLRDGMAVWAATPRPEGWLDLRAVLDRRVHVVDGGAFATAGPRVIDGIEILAELFDPAAFDGMAPPDTWVRAG
jgi:iron complex transport system substrate-binding protein